MLGCAGGVAFEYDIKELIARSERTHLLGLIAPCIAPKFSGSAEGIQSHGYNGIAAP